MRNDITISEGLLSGLEYEFGVEGEEEVKSAILQKVDDAHKVIDELGIENITDVFKTQYVWVDVINIICEGLCLENYFLKNAQRDFSLICANDKFTNEDGSAKDQFGIGNCSHLNCPNRESDEDGFICNKHGLWLPPALPNGNWFSGHGIVLGGADPKTVQFILGGGD